MHIRMLYIRKHCNKWRAVGENLTSLGNWASRKRPQWRWLAYPWATRNSEGEWINGLNDENLIPFLKFQETFFARLAKLLQISIFDYFSDLWNVSRNSDKTPSKLSTQLANFVSIVLLSSENMAKKVDESFLNFWGLAGAKGCNSCTSRQELSK